MGDRTTVNELFVQIKTKLLPRYPHLQGTRPVYRDFRSGDVRHSLADISKAATRPPNASASGGRSHAVVYSAETMNKKCSLPL